MKQVHQTALKRAAGAFLILHEHEWAALDGLPSWAVRLFMLLIRCTDFKTGHGDTSYSYLAERMAPVQPDRGPKHFAPTAQAVKRMVLAFEQRRILARDIKQSDGTRTLFFSLAPRYEPKAAKARPEKNLTPMPEPHASSKNAAATGQIDAQAEELDPQSRPPLAGMNLLSFPQPVDNLAGTPRTEQIRVPPSSRFVQQARAENERRKRQRDAAGGEQVAPQGGQDIAATPHAPPGRIGSGRSVLNSHQQTDEGPSAPAGLRTGALHGLQT